MKHRILATEIAVTPFGASRLVYGLSVVSFEADGDINAVYGALRTGKKVQVADLEISEYKKEEPGLLLAEYPLEITATSSGWLLAVRL